MGQGRDLAADFRGAERRVATIASPHRLLNHPSPSACGRWKKGGPDHAIGRSRGGLSTKIHAVVDDLGLRSEEHTSELQSLMRISYAVFCLKKKIQYNKHTT